MELTLAVLVGFVLACVGWPQLVRSRPHFLLGAAMVALAMLFTALAVWQVRVFAFLSGITQVAAFLLIVMGGSGIRLTELGRSLGNSLREL